jgi:2-keto-4-pentenoate hydratase/2-oxohepta-3-ene-1,7-dioic acid hydratase in catechol pathway
VKFTQFEVTSEPGVRRTGMAFEGKFYETDGVNAIAVHEPMDVRLLTPINRPGSVRFFDVGELAFVYANPHTMFGPSETLPLDPGNDRVSVVPCLGLVIGGAGRKAGPRDADDLVLGLTMVNSFRSDSADGSALDLGFSVGPVITTPDEFEDSVTVDVKGRRYRTSITCRLNSVDQATYRLTDLTYTPAELISYASQYTALREGDLIAIAIAPPISLDRGDEFSLVGEKMGALTNRLI